MFGVEFKKNPTDSDLAMFENIVTYTMFNDERIIL